MILWTRKFIKPGYVEYPLVWGFSCVSQQDILDVKGQRKRKNLGFYCNIQGAVQEAGELTTSLQSPQQHVGTRLKTKSVPLWHQSQLEMLPQDPSSREEILEDLEAGGFSLGTIKFCLSCTLGSCEVTLAAAAVQEQASTAC